MKYFCFSGESEAVLKEISSGLVGVAVNKMGGQATDVVFRLLSGREVRVVNRMHDVAERFEIGVLDFVIDGAGCDDEFFRELPSDFREMLGVERLVWEDSNVYAESGIVIHSCRGNRIVVVAAATPCTLSVDVLGEGFGISESEYPLDAYVRRPL